MPAAGSPLALPGLAGHHGSDWLSGPTVGFRMASGLLRPVRSRMEAVRPTRGPPVTPPARCASPLSARRAGSATAGWASGPGSATTGTVPSAATPARVARPDRMPGSPGRLRTAERTARTRPRSPPYMLLPLLPAGHSGPVNPRPSAGPLDAGSSGVSGGTTAASAFPPAVSCAAFGLRQGPGQHEVPHRSRLARICPAERGVPTVLPTDRRPGPPSQASPAGRQSACPAVRHRTMSASRFTRRRLGRPHPKGKPGEAGPFFRGAPESQAGKRPELARPQLSSGVSLQLAGEMPAGPALFGNGCAPPRKRPAILRGDQFRQAWPPVTPDRRLSANRCGCDVFWGPTGTKGPAHEGFGLAGRPLSCPGIRVHGKRSLKSA